MKIKKKEIKKRGEETHRHRCYEFILDLNGIQFPPHILCRSPEELDKKFVLSISYHDKFIIIKKNYHNIEWRII